MQHAPRSPDVPGATRGAAATADRRAAATRLVVVAVASASALVPSAAHAAGTEQLDAVRPVAVAASGPTVAWLRPSDRLAAHARLVVRDAAGAVPRVLAQELPVRPVALTIGTTRSGKPVAVVATAGTTSYRPRPSSQPVRRGALYVLPLDGSAAPKRLRVSAPGTDLYHPGLLRGRLTFARLQGTTAKPRWTVRTGTLDGRSSRQVAGPKARTAISATTPIRDGGVAYTSSTYDRTTSGYAFRLQVVRASGRTTVISKTAIGGSGESEMSFGPLTISPDGAHLSAIRAQDGLRTWSVPGGKRRAAAERLRYDGVAVPVGEEGTAVVDRGILELVPAQR